MLLALQLTLLTFGQSFTVNDLLKLSSLPPSGIDRFMSKNGYDLAVGKLQNNIMENVFALKPKIKKKYFGPKRTIEIGFNGDTKTFILHTSSFNELIAGQQVLAKDEFIYDQQKNIFKDSSIFFQKLNSTIQTSTEVVDSSNQYTFALTVKRVPDKIKYAEDLLKFDSEQYLISFFGEQNVKNDLYYFSEKELKKCSVLFGGAPYQVVFIWSDEINLDKLSYIIVPHSLPTASAIKDNPVTGNNEWQFRNGIYAGMEVKELLRLNQADFDIYGNQSEFAFMIKPAADGNIDFKKTSVTLSCPSCEDLNIFNQRQISALEVTRKDIPMYVRDVILYPSVK